MDAHNRPLAATEFDGTFGGTFWTPKWRYCQMPLTDTRIRNAKPKPKP
jgi:hypothetical protein